MTIRLIDGITTDLVAMLDVQPTSVSEILLRLPKKSHETLANMLIPMGFTINEQGLLTPFKMIEWQKFIHMGSKNRSDLPQMRVDVLNKLRSWYKKRTLDKWLWPPSGEMGMWDQENRIFSSVYQEHSRKYGVEIPSDLAKKYRITDDGSLTRAIHDGAIVLLGSETIDVTPSGGLNRLATPTLNCPCDIPQLNVLYRGTKSFYKNPLIPSLQREFPDGHEAQNYRRIFDFTINIVLETVADEFGILLTFNEAESIIQHYKILPWTSMIDLTCDVNIAKAFAAGSRRYDTHPHLYQVVVWNIGLFDSGAQLINELPFERPRAQKAIACFGLGLDMTTNNFVDKYRLLVAVTELVAGKDGSGWERYGGQSFSIGDNEFPSPFLTESESEKLDKLLYYHESETDESRRVINRIVNTIERNMDFFQELGKRSEKVGNGLKILKKYTIGKTSE